jgi:hypothetical protein
VCIALQPCTAKWRKAANLKYQQAFHMTISVVLDNLPPEMAVAFIIRPHAVAARSSHDDVSLKLNNSMSKLAAQGEFGL